MSNYQNDVYYEQLLERASDMVDRWLSTPLEQELVQAIDAVNESDTLANLERLSDVVSKAEGQASQEEFYTNDCI